jgi:hypothetical protein
MYDILLLNPTAIPKSAGDRIKGSLTYCEKTLNIYSTIDTNRLDED